jgi:hypothetical protein
VCLNLRHRGDSKRALTQPFALIAAEREC